MADETPRRRKKDSRQRILEVAAKLFDERGYHATTMDEVAATVELNKATIYHYFSSKSDLLYEIYDQAAELTLDGMRAIPDDLPAHLALQRLITYHLDMMSRDRASSGVYFGEVRWLPQWLTPAQLATIRDKESKYTSYVTSLIERGVREGSFSTDDPRIATFAILGMIAWSRLWRRPRGRLSTEELADRFIRFVFVGLGGSWPPEVD